MIPDEIKLGAAVATAELVADRRGSRIWKVTLEDGSLLALKYAIDNDDTQGVQGNARLLAAREAAVLHHIDYGQYLFGAGETELGTWLAVAWLEAPTLLDRWKPVREQLNEQARVGARQATWLAATAIGKLHTQGWRHCDLQAAHIYVGGKGHLIDLALAQGPVAVVPDLPYRGALAHLAAPEVAQQILDTPNDLHVEVTTAAEIYTFGAVLYAAWTKRWPHTYPDGPLTLDAIYRAISDTKTSRALPEGWPHMSRLLGSMLEPDPASRPTIHEVGLDVLEQIPRTE